MSVHVMILVHSSIDSSKHILATFRAGDIYSERLAKDEYC